MILSSFLNKGQKCYKMQFPEKKHQKDVQLILTAESSVLILNINFKTISSPKFMVSEILHVNNHQPFGQNV